jgi:hypothetical protein
MKLASLKHGRDGRLVVVSRDLTRATDDGRPAARFVGHVGPSWTAPAAEATAGVQASLMSDPPRPGRSMMDRRARRTGPQACRLGRLERPQQRATGGRAVDEAVDEAELGDDRRRQHEGVEVALSHRPVDARRSSPSSASSTASSTARSDIREA